jgi:hypothetical protein
MTSTLQHVGCCLSPCARADSIMPLPTRRQATSTLRTRANDAVDVLDPGAGRYLFSIPDLRGIAGVLVSQERLFVITSNRGENAIGIFAPGDDPRVGKVSRGTAPERSCL